MGNTPQPSNLTAKPQSEKTDDDGEACRELGMVEIEGGARYTGRKNEAIHNVHGSRQHINLQNFLNSRFTFLNKNMERWFTFVNYFESKIGELSRMWKIQTHFITDM